MQRVDVEELHIQRNVLDVLQREQEQTLRAATRKAEVYRRLLRREAKNIRRE